MEKNIENNKNIYQKLQQARVELQEKKLQKTGLNKYAGFKYYELSDFLPSLNKICLDVGLATCFNLREDTAVLTVIDANSPTDKEELIFSTPLPEKYEQKGSTPIQQLGGLHTYLKRYLYMNAFEIVEDDSIDNQNPNEICKKETSEAVKVAPTPVKPTPETVKVVPPSKANPGVQTAKPPMEKEDIFNFLVKFLNQPVKDSQKAFGWAKRIQETDKLNIEEKKQFLESIDNVYQTKYYQEFLRKYEGRL